MLLFLTTNKNIGLFDFLMEDQGMLVKKLCSEFYLKKFVIHDMRSLNHYAYVAIDIGSLKDTDDEIIEAVIAFKAMYSVRLIFFAEGIANSLLAKLFKEDIYNIITATTIEAIREEILICVSAEGMTYKQVKNIYPVEQEMFGLQSKYSFLCKDIQIAVAGASPKAGTTTTAFNIANYLISIGASACYVESNGNNHLRTLTMFHNDICTNENSIEYKGIKYYFKGNQPPTCNFIIYDCGELKTYKSENYLSAHIKILCGTGKPYELGNLMNMAKLLTDEMFHFVLSFVPEINKEILAAYLKHNKIHYAGYSPDLFNGEPNKHIWRKILNDYIVEYKTL
jgi:hypothetical protein